MAANTANGMADLPVRGVCAGMPKYNPQNDVMIRLNTVEEVKPPRFLRDGLRIPNRVHVLDKVLTILKNGH